MNFDPLDKESRLTLLVMNQDVLGSTTIAKVQLGAVQVERLEEPAGAQHGKTAGWGVTGTRSTDSVWASSRFHCVDLVPAGKIYLRFSPVSAEDEDFGVTCCGCCCPRRADP